MNDKMHLLHPYPFEKLRVLMNGIHAPQGMKPIALNIGEPKHATPQVVLEAMQQSLPLLAKYPTTAGTQALRESCAGWVQRRYGVSLDWQREIISVNGSREALFAFVQATFNAHHPQKDTIICPNPFYQIYEGAALLAGAKTVYANTDAPHFLPDWSQIDAQTWQKTQIVFVCTPGNPTGALMRQADWEALFALQDEYQFTIASDECYSEIYFDEQPIGILQAAFNSGRDLRDKIMFTSLSKRSNVPGLRSGFVAGDADLLAHFLHYRTYHGCAMSETTQHASIAAWNDENHVVENRHLYRQKFRAVIEILQKKYDVKQPDASFYLWLPVPDGNDVAFAQDLWRKCAIQVLPGSLLGREGTHGNAGAGYVRIALVATLDECIEAAQRMCLP